MTPQTLVQLMNEKTARYGEVWLGDRRYFYKRVSKADYERELVGHKYLSQFYPVAPLATHSAAQEMAILVFEYDESIGYNQGLLVDVAAQGESMDKLSPVFEMYHTAFRRSLTRGTGETSAIFFADRVTTRLPRFYSADYVAKMSGREVEVGGVKVELALGKVLKGVEQFFAAPKTTWCVASQSDPNDLNVGTKPVLFDYTAGGPVPLMAEFATFFWYNLAQGNYLALKYNATAFEEHPAIYDAMDKATYRDGRLVHQVSDWRKQMLVAYIEKVIEPVMPESFDGWYEEFKNYLAMKALAVWNVAEMDEVDQVLTLSYLAKFYSQDFSSIEELKQAVREL